MLSEPDSCYLNVEVPEMAVVVLHFLELGDDIVATLEDLRDRSNP